MAGCTLQRSYPSANSGDEHKVRTEARSSRGVNNYFSRPSFLAFSPVPYFGGKRTTPPRPGSVGTLATTRPLRRISSLSVLPPRATGRAGPAATRGLRAGANSGRQDAWSSRPAVPWSLSALPTSFRLPHRNTASRLGGASPCIAQRTASVVRALPCKTCPIAHPSIPEWIMHHQITGPNT